MKKIEITKWKAKCQRTWIMYHLKKFGQITTWEAIKEYGATRLSAIIFNLRDEGYNIESRPASRINRFGNSVNYVQYVYHPTKKTAPKSGQKELFDS